MQLPRVLACLVVGFAGLVASGCGGNIEASLRTRAAYDMSCPESEVRITNLGGETRGVDACGQRMTYIHVCRDMAFGACTAGDWVANAGGETPSR